MLLFAGAGLWYVHTASFRQWSLDSARAALREFDIDLRAASLDYDLIRLRVWIRGLEVRAARNADLPPIFTARQIDLRLRWRTITAGVLDVERLHVTGPAVALVWDANGRSNLPQPPPRETGEPFEIPEWRISDLKFTQGSLAVRDAAHDAEVTVPTWQMDLRERDLVLASSGPARVRFAASEFTLERLRLEGRVDPAELLFEKANLLADFNLAPLTPGSLALRATAAGKQIEATLAGSGFDLTFDAAARMSLDEERVELTRLRAGSPYGVAEAAGVVALTEAAGQSELRATAVLDRLLPLRTRARITAEASFPGLDYEQARARARIAAEVRDYEGVRITGALAMDRARRLSGNLLLNVPSLEAVDANLRGVAQLEAKLGGTVTEPTAEATLAASQLGAGVIQDASLHAAISASLARVEISEALLEWRDQSIRGQGALDLTKAKPELAFDAASEGFTLERTLPGLDVHEVPVSGRFEFSASATGPLDNIAATLRLDAHGLEAYREPLGHLALSAGFADQVLTVHEARLDKPGSEPLVLEGEFSPETDAYRFALHAAALRFERLELPGPLPVRGALSLSAGGAGTLAEPALALDARVDALIVDSVELGPVETSAKVRQGAARVDLYAPRFNLRAALDAGLEAPYSATFTLDAAGTDLGALPLPDGLPLAGRLRAAVKGAGPLGQPEAIEAKLQLEPEELRWNGEAVTTGGPIEAALAGMRLAIRRAEFSVADTAVSLSGEFPLDEAGAPGMLHLRAAADLAGLPKLAPGWPKDQKIEGRATLDATLRGTLADPVPEGTLSLADGRIESAAINPVTGLALNASFRDGQFRVMDLAGEWAGAKLSGEAASPWPLTKGGPPARLRLALDGLNPARIQGAPPQTSGLLSLRLEAEADEPEIAAVRGALVFNELQLRLSDIPVAQQGASTVRLAHGEVTVEKFTLMGPGTELGLSGSVSLLNQPSADFRVDGRVETGLLAGLLAPLRLRGPATIGFSARGPLDSIETAGTLELTGIEASVPEPRLAAEALNARIEFKGDRVQITRLDGLLNGGKLKGGGSVTLKDGAIGEADIELAATGVYLDYPADFRTVSNTSLQFRGTPGGYRLTGGIDLVEGAFREVLTLETGLLAYLNSEQGVDLTDERNELLERTRLDIAVKTSAPLLINNNLARAELNADLRVVGTPYRPSLLGRIDVEEGGEIYLAERTYPVERGVITFTNEQRIEPSLDILARTRAGGLDITLQVEGGGAERLETRLTSDPPEPEPDIIAVLITGRPLEEIRGSDATTMASRQVLSYLAGSLGGRFTRELERATGISKVRVEPDLIAAESNPTARLTVGQDLTRDARLIYSMNLANGGDQVWVAEYDLTRRFVTRGIKQVDNTYRFEFRHDVRFGGGAAQRREQRVRQTIGTVRADGGMVIPEKQLLRRLKARTGRRYDFFAVRQGLDRIEKAYDQRDRLEARVRLERNVEERTVDLTLTVDEGPRVLLKYEGYTPARKVRKQVRKLWRDGVFDGQRLDETARAVREALVRRGHYEAVVEAATAEPEPGMRIVTFTSEPGTRYRKPDVEFTGNSSITGRELRAVIDKQKFRPVLFLSAGRVTDLLSRYYRERGYLDAALPAPQVEFDRAARRAVVTLTVKEGPAYSVGEIRVAGNEALKTEGLIEKMPLRSGASYTPALRQESLDRVLDAYQSAGYTNAQVDTRATRADPGRVDLDVKITEGPKEVVESLEVEGERAVSEKLIQSQLALKPGDAVDPSKVSLSRRRLYSTGAFALVDIERIPLSPGAAVTPGQQPVRLRARVREVQPFDVRYGAYFDTDRGMGGVVDVTNRNSLGSARVLGLRGRLDREIRETRLFFSQPLLERLPLQTIATTYLRRERFPDFINDRVGVSAQQELRFRQRYTMNYGYRLENVRTYDRVPDPFFPFDISLRVAPLTWTLNRESRDDLLDATRGSFTSHSLEYAPAGIGSQLNFIRYYGQFFKYVPLSAPAELPLGGGIRRPRLVYAGAARVGLATGLRGQELVRSERFFTGGGTTLRGFAQNSAGPVDFFGDPRGGDALLLLNNELRFPLIGFLEGVGFSDIGNVFTSPSAMSFRDLRKTGGGGLRIRTPYFLLRLDYGLILDRKPGESRGGFFFSIGQAF